MLRAPQPGGHPVAPGRTMREFMMNSDQIDSKS
jgi:hypothetical protein